MNELRRDCKFQYILKNSKKNHWLQVSASKLLGDESSQIKIPNEFLGQNFQKKV